MDYKLGYIPSAQPATFRLRRYAPTLPVPPDAFGHYALVKDWGMYSNDRLGCCVISGGEHEHLLWTREGDAADANFDDAVTVTNYSAITGYNPADPSSDRGTDLERAARYRRRTGLLDANGVRHKISAYLSIDTDDIPVATWLFGAVGVGVEFPASAMDQFNAGEPWDVVKGSEVEGGHYICIVGRMPNGNLLCVTWGRLQQVTPQFLKRYTMEALAYLSREALTKGLSLEGNNFRVLERDLAAL